MRSRSTRAGGTSRSRPTPSELEDHLGFWLRFVSNHVSGRFRRLVEARGVTVSEWVALREMYGEDSVSPSRLVESLGMTKGAISKVLDRLEKRNLARRIADRDDGRAQHVALTAAGRALVPELAALADENDAHFFDHLPAATRRDLVAALRDIVSVHRLTEVPTT